MTDFEQIYKDYFRDVFLYVRRLSGGDERLAEDITGEAFFRALRHIDSFRGDSDIRAWLCQIAKNWYSTHLTPGRRRRNCCCAARMPGRKTSCCMRFPTRTKRFLCGELLVK